MTIDFTFLMVVELEEQSRMACKNAIEYTNKRKLPIYPITMTMTLLYSTSTIHAKILHNNMIQQNP